MIKLRRQFEDLLRESGLLQERGDGALTSSERMARHGEIRQLREAKRNHAKEVTGLLLWDIFPSYGEHVLMWQSYCSIFWWSCDHVLVNWYEKGCVHIRPS